MIHAVDSIALLNKINSAIKRCLTFITEGDGDPGLVRDELKSLEARKDCLEWQWNDTNHCAQKDNCNSYTSW